MTKPTAPLTAENIRAIRHVASSFTSSMPAAISRAGQHELRHGDRCADEIVDAPDGLYRVMGSDWIVTIGGKRLKAVKRATPPDYGGDRVVSVPAST